jgi:hypothetical protein
MIYNKTIWDDDGGQIGGKAALENMENAMKPIGQVGALTSTQFMSTTNVTSSLNMTSYTNGKNIGFGDFDKHIADMYSAGGADKVVFDRRCCAIYDIDYFDTTSGVPRNLHYLRGNSTNPSASDILTWEYTGRILTNLASFSVTEIPSEETTVVVIDAPAHGLPVNTVNLEGYIAAGGFAESGTAAAAKLSITFAEVTSPDTLTINKTLAQYNAALANLDGADGHLFMDSAISMQGGGNDYSVGDTHTCYITWAWDPTSPFFPESLATEVLG